MGEAECFSKNSEDRGVPVLTIGKIDLKLNIFNDGGEEDMNIGALHVEKTPYYWEEGNTFLSSHNTRVGSVLFNNLDKLEIGDEIKISDSLGIYRYTIYNIDIVNPDNTECFNKLEGKQNLSLVTCSNLGKDRLVVYCKKSNPNC